MRTRRLVVIICVAVVGSIVAVAVLVARSHHPTRLTITETTLPPAVERVRPDLASFTPPSQFASDDPLTVATNWENLRERALCKADLSLLYLLYVEPPRWQPDWPEVTSGKTHACGRIVVTGVQSSTAGDEVVLDFDAQRIIGMGPTDPVHVHLVLRYVGGTWKAPTP